jgi:hypothetical protein
VRNGEKEVGWVKKGKMAEVRGLENNGIQLGKVLGVKHQDYFTFYAQGHQKCC